MDEDLCFGKGLSNGLKMSGCWERAPPFDDGTTNKGPAASQKFYHVTMIASFPYDPSS